MSTLTLKDKSTEPYAWMTEGVEKKDVRDVSPVDWVIETAKAAADATDADYDKWLEETNEFEEAIVFLAEWLAE